MLMLVDIVSVTEDVVDTETEEDVVVATAAGKVRVTPADEQRV